MGNTQRKIVMKCGCGVLYDGYVWMTMCPRCYRAKRDRVSELIRFRATEYLADPSKIKLDF